MSRINYTEEEERPGQFALWHANIRRQMFSQRGQRVLRDMEAALLAMPEKRLINGYVAHEGEVCAVGSYVAHKRTLAQQKPWAEVVAEMEAHDLEWNGPYADEADPDYAQDVAAEADIPSLIAWAAVDENEHGPARTPEERHELVLKWVRSWIKQEATA